MVKWSQRNYMTEQTPASRALPLPDVRREARGSARDPQGTPLAPPQHI